MTKAVITLRRRSIYSSRGRGFSRDVRSDGGADVRICAELSAMKYDTAILGNRFTAGPEDFKLLSTAADETVVVSHPCDRKMSQGWSTDLCFGFSTSQLP